jgi:hypothetical protein
MSAAPAQDHVACARTRSGDFTMPQNTIIARDAAPDILLADAMGLGRELSDILRADIGLFDHRDRLFVETCARVAEQRRIMEPRFRGSFDTLFALLDRRIAAATVEKVEYEIARVDEHGEHVEAIRVRTVSDEARPLVRARQLAGRMVALVDRARDHLAAEQAILDAIRGGAAR